MASKQACACCGSAASGIRTCATCKAIGYCSKECQKRHRRAHKARCDMLAVADKGPPVRTAEEARKLPTEVMNIYECRIAVFSLLPLRDLLRYEQVDRSWCRTIASERALQQRLSLTPGPGALVKAAYDDNDEPYLSIQPRDTKQVGHTKKTKRPVWGGGFTHLLDTGPGATEQVRAVELEKRGIPMVLNPFFTWLWPQDPTNMTWTPHNPPTASLKTASWRRMQFTSPPMLKADLQIWYSYGDAGGNQLLPTTGNVATGVTLGHIANVLTAQLIDNKDLHWLQIHGYAW
ncbi:hypothetical protein LTR15_001273 [Elasticomyces elasticus]|nr:hypothetical protein LTR15_001273 [Elasticomyces elasticus]